MTAASRGCISMSPSGIRRLRVPRIYREPRLFIILTGVGTRSNRPWSLSNSRERERERESRKWIFEEHYRVEEEEEEEEEGAKYGLYRIVMVVRVRKPLIFYCAMERGERERGDRAREREQLVHLMKSIGRIFCSVMGSMDCVSPEWLICSGVKMLLNSYCCWFYFRHGNENVIY